MTQFVRGQTLREKFVRMGHCGPSFHEFEIAMGEDVHNCVISNEFDTEINDMNKAYRVEHDILQQYLSKRAPHVSSVFAMPLLYFILRKPGNFRPDTHVSVDSQGSDQPEGVVQSTSLDTTAEQRKKIVETLYARVFNRAPAKKELDYWVSRCHGFSSMSRIIDEFFESDEYKMRSRENPA